MRADDPKAARKTCTLAFNAVRIEERAVIVGPPIHLSFLLHDPHIGIRDAESAFFVIVRDSFQKSLPPGDFYPAPQAKKSQAKSGKLKLNQGKGARNSRETGVKKPRTFRRSRRRSAASTQP